MFTDIENLKLIDIFRTSSSRFRSFNGRFSHAIVIKLSGTSVYDFSGKILYLEPDEAIFIPKGSFYTVRLLSESGEYVIINFDADITSPKPEKFLFSNYPYRDFLESALPKLWHYAEAGQKFKCYSAFYNLLSFLHTSKNADYAYKSKADKINPAIQYLQENIFSCDLKPGELHLLCNMSDTYFRKIFKSCYGTSAQEYVINKRLSRAESIILSGDYSSVAEVSKAVGYSDSLYFSRIFAKQFGICPSQYLHWTEKQTMSDL